MNPATNLTGNEIAIVGMAGRFPGANTIEAFWHNLQAGKESISFFSDEELQHSVRDQTLLRNPNYVKAGTVLDGIDLFDAAFFGYSPREAETIDPQQRLFLECAWQAIEHAGYDVSRYPGLIGVYAGLSLSRYVFSNLYMNQHLHDIVDGFQVMLGNAQDFLATRVAYKLNLRGPCMTIQTACSTSLVAVHLACQSLLSGDCDMALAGGVSIATLQKTGYFYLKGSIYSPDGHCRAFDAQAEGTINGSGLGVVVLKRLTDALDQRDTIYAVIRGSAINNDGAMKVGFTAPSVQGQAAVITDALMLSGAEPETISYIETHGTGTPLGDTIEVAALRQAFEASTSRKGFCALGSVKTNIGHLDTAAGIAGLIKTVLALQHQQIPPSLHFQTPNQQIDFASSPFYVNTQLSAWKRGETPRRAGVSSFGFGGTNAHVILEEAPACEVSASARPWFLLVFSARSKEALQRMKLNLQTALTLYPNEQLADIAYTLQVGRQAFAYRQMLVCRNCDEARTSLDTESSIHCPSNEQEEISFRPVVFLFPGQGSQYVQMALGLYQDEPLFREQIDRCSQLLLPHLGEDLRHVLFPSEKLEAEAAQLLRQTRITQPALFVIEYALAQMWQAWGVHPQAMLGHSLGEYVAACLAGVFSLEDALALVTIRGQLMDQVQGGAMLVVSLPEQLVYPLLNNTLSVAAINTETQCVVSGPQEAVWLLDQQLEERGVRTHRLPTTCAFHSTMMEELIEPFTSVVSTFTLHAPRLPYLSNVTGSWITPEQATDPSYWGQHLRQTVRFVDGLYEVLKDTDQIFLEIGPGHSLSSFIQQMEGLQSQKRLFASLPTAQERLSDTQFVLTTLGKLWLAGVDVDWAGLYVSEQRRKLPLPTYPFERQRYWIEPSDTTPSLTDHSSINLEKHSDPTKWFYVPRWKQALPPYHTITCAPVIPPTCWLIFLDNRGIGSHLGEYLRQRELMVIYVKAGECFQQKAEQIYTINPGCLADYETLWKEFTKLKLVPDKIVHLWTVENLSAAYTQEARVEQALDQGFYSLAFLAQTLGKRGREQPIDIWVISDHMQLVSGEEEVYPEKALVLGPCLVIPQEYPHITCQSIDIRLPPRGSWQENQLCEQLVREVLGGITDRVVAYRGKYRWIQDIEAMPLEETQKEAACLRPNGVYLITGGTGRIGLVIAEYLAQRVQATLILLGRSTFPAREHWERWIERYGSQDRLSQKIRKIQELEALGARVLIVQADVADEEQMLKVLMEAERQIGPIHGVIHAADIINDNLLLTIDRIQRDECERIFQSKVYGLLVLEKIFRGKQLDFCLLQSSISTVLGGSGFIAYTAANIFMDAVAYQQSQLSPARWLSVNWDNWQLLQGGEPGEGMGAQQAELAISQEEGIIAFSLILSTNFLSRIIISTADLQARIDRWVKREDFFDLKNGGGQELLLPYPRPDLSNLYIEPRNGVEQAIATVWSNMLAIERIGIHDDFFRLGGDSLVGTRIVSQLCNLFEVELSLHSFFEASTIARVAEVIEEIVIERLEDLPENED